MPIISEDVLLRIRGQWAGAEVQRGLRQLEQEVRRVGQSARGALSILLPGAGIGIAGGLALAVRESIRLAGEFEKMKLGLTSILGSYGEVVDAQGRVLKGAERFNTLLRMSASLMSEIRKEADRTILDTRELMEYVQTGLGFGLAKGLTQQQVVQLISNIAVAGRTMGLPQGYPIISEIRALLSGQNLRASQIAQAIGISASQLQQLSGNELFRYLTERLKGFVDTSDAFARSFEAQWSTFISKVQEVLATVGEAIVPVLADFARDAARAIDEWKRSGGPERLKRYVREVLQSVVGIASWLKNVADWFQKTPGALRLARDIGAAAAGARVGGLFGPWGAAIGGAIGAAGVEAWDLLSPSEGARAEERQLQRMGALLSKATGISAYHPGRYTTAPPAAPATAGAGGVQYRVRPAAPVETPEQAAQRAAALRQARQQQQIAQRAAEMSASLAVRQADRRLQEALQAAATQGWTSQAVARVRSAYQAWRQASLQQAAARSAGEPAPIARQILAEAQFEVAERQQEIESSIRRGVQEAQQASARQAMEQLEYLQQRVRALAGIPLHEALYGAFTAWLPLPVQVAAAPFAPIGQEMLRVMLAAAQAREQEVQAQTQRFVAMMERAAALEERRRLFSYQMFQTLSAYGERWAQAFGVAAPLAGGARLMMGVLSPIAQALVDAIGEGMEQVRKEWQQFWQDMATFTSNSIRDAFVRMTMDFMDNVSRWEDAIKNFVRSIKQMIQRAIAEWVYESYIKRGVESLLGSILGKAQESKKPSFGQVLAGVALSAAVSWGLGQILPGLFRFQHGGSALAGRLALVGERGPELIVPGVTSAIISSEAVVRALARLENMGSPAQINISINHDGDLGLARRVGREVERGLRRWRY